MVSALACTPLNFFISQYSTVQYSTVLYCTVLHCTVLYCTVLYGTVLYCTVLHCTVLYCTVLYCIVVDSSDLTFNDIRSCGFSCSVVVFSCNASCCRINLCAQLECPLSPLAAVIQGENTNWYNSWPPPWSMKHHRLWCHHRSNWNTVACWQTGNITCIPKGISRCIYHPQRDCYARSTKIKW